MIRITDTIGIEERELDERFVRASGPGGQNVNKVSTAVELRFDVRASSLPYDMKQRLIALAGSRMTGDEVLLIDSREHRTQAMNREAARARLVALLQAAAKRPKTRRPTKPKRAAKGKAAGVQASAERGQVPARPRPRLRRLNGRRRVYRSTCWTLPAPTVAAVRLCARFSTGSPDRNCASTSGEYTSRLAWRRRPLSSAAISSAFSAER